MPAQRLSSAVAATIAAAAALFLAAHSFGAISLVGYETKSIRQVGPLTTGGPWNLTIGMPVWLRQGEAVAATYDVDAKFGAVVLGVHPPLFLRTPLQAARFSVEGQKGGTVHFVARSAGWYTFGIPKYGETLVTARAP